MRQTQQLRNGSRLRGAQPARRWKPVSDDTLVLWTPLTPREIAKELRPFLVSQARRGDTGPKVRGTLASWGMRIQRYQPGEPQNFPRLHVEYELISDGTLLFGKIVPTGADRLVSTLLNLTFLGIAGAVTYQFRNLLATLAIGVGLLAVRVLQTMFQQAGHRFVTPWYQRFLTDVLMAEDVGS